MRNLTLKNIRDWIVNNLTALGNILASKNQNAATTIIASNTQTGTAAQSSVGATDGTYTIALLRYNTGHNAYGQLVATDGAVYSNSSIMHFAVDNAVPIWKWTGSSGLSTNYMTLNSSGLSIPGILDVTGKITGRGNFELIGVTQCIIAASNTSGSSLLDIFLTDSGGGSPVIRFNRNSTAGTIVRFCKAGLVTSVLDIVDTGINLTGLLSTTHTAQNVSNLNSTDAAGAYMTLQRSGASTLIWGHYAAASGGGSTIHADALFLRSANGVGLGGNGASVALYTDTNNDVYIPFGSLLVKHSAGSIGYAAGAGGTVTQATSRTTAVTLNKASGAITLVSAAGSAAWQTFTVNNSLVAATDTIRVCQKSGADLYQIHVTAVAAGSFNITFATTGGTTVEQPVFNFSILKGVTA